MARPTLSAIDPTRGRSATFRMVEWLLLLGFFALLAWLTVASTPALLRSPLSALAGAVLAAFTMDFVSGLLHWAGDTWGSVRWPLIGATVIRTFREHHVDETAITRHDFIEVNAASTFFALPFLLVGLCSGPDAALWRSFGMVMAVGALFTNQAHSWAHRTDSPAWVRSLQRLGVMLSPEAHSLHHVAPYTDHYCITLGWLNKPLAKVRFWRRCERVVSALTGAVPRAEDAIAKEVL
jgi:hypothetical protein